MEFQQAPDIQKRMARIVLHLGMVYIDSEKIKCFRSHGSKTGASARIWSFPKIWQLALGVSPHYIIEVVTEKFDKLTSDEQDKVLIHELLHIPRNFSGALLPHRSRGRSINMAIINNFFARLKK